MQTAVEPFPWKSLETVTRAQVEARREVRWWIASHVRPGAFAEALRAILGAEVELRVRRTVARMPRRPGEDAVAVRVAGTGEVPGQAMLEVEVPLAAAVAARVTRRPPVALAKADAPPASSLAGALAAVITAAARKACAGPALRVLAAGPAAALEPALLAEGALGGQIVAVELTVLLADEAYAARLILPARSVAGGSPEEWSREALAALGPLPLCVPVVACASVSTAGDIASLRPGDVWLPGAWPLEIGASGLVGPVVLAAPGASLGVRARLVADGQLVLSGEVDALSEEAGMTISDGTTPLIDAVGEVPVVVRVEIGEATMAARAWAGLGKGDVVTLGKRVGDRVLLRVGGVPVARGELVSVEGEVGVRIAEILTEAVTRA